MAEEPFHQREHFSPRRIEVKGLDRFPLFDEKGEGRRITFHWGKKDVPELLLNVEKNRYKPEYKPPYTSPPLYQSQVFTPFQPEIGYTIGAEFHPNPALFAKRRYERLKRDDDELNYVEVPNHFTLMLAGQVNDKDTTALHVFKPETIEYDQHGQLIEPQFTAKYEKLFSLLRFQVLFPNGVGFEAKPDSYVLQHMFFGFNKYYPFDLGELPTLSSSGTLQYEGLYLLLPSNPQTVAQVQGRFRIAHPMEAHRRGRQTP